MRYIPCFVVERKRSEQALIQVVQEAFINGVSTRKIERLAKSMGIESLSAGQVSEINKELDDQVRYFRTRPLEKTYPVIWVDALYEKIRYDGRVMTMAVLVVAGVTLEGPRDMPTVEPMFRESEETYRELFEGLEKRGIKDVWLCISDCHQGLEAAHQAQRPGLRDQCVCDGLRARRGRGSGQRLCGRGKGLGVEMFRAIRE